MFSYQLPAVARKKERQEKHRYGIDGVVVDGLGRAGGLYRGEQGPLSFNYDL